MRCQSIQALVVASFAAIAFNVGAQTSTPSTTPYGAQGTPSTTAPAATGAVGGGVVGAVVGGPVGAAVGAGVGGYAGHYEAQPGGIAQPNTSAPSTGGTTISNSSELVRSAQQSLNDKGYDVGPVDGQLGP